MCDRRTLTVFAPAGALVAASCGRVVRADLPGVIGNELGDEAVLPLAGGTPQGTSYTLTDFYGDNDIYLSEIYGLKGVSIPVSTPVPSALVLGAMGLGMVARIRRRSERKAV